MIETLSLKTARRIIAEAITAAHDLELSPMSVAVLDAGGHLKAFEREDGASTHRFQIAFGKAHGALALGTGSRALMERAESQPYFITAAAMAIGGALIPVPGGVLLSGVDGPALGAVGVSGDTSDSDEKVTVAGITAVGYRAITG